MSITGIDKVKSSSTIFVDVANKGMVNNLYSKVAYLNAEFDLNSNYVNNVNLLIGNSVDTKNTKMTLSNPSAGFVNLGFAFINVSSNLQSQNSSSLISNSELLNVENSLTYSYTLNKSNLKVRDISEVTVLSTNSEYEITLNLDGTSLPEVSILYPNKGINENIIFDVSAEWS